MSAKDKQSRPPLLPAPTVAAPLKVQQCDIDDEVELRELAAFCFDQAKAAADEPSGPKWMAEGLKAQRQARTIRDKINEIENDARRMEFMRKMKGLS